MFYSQEILQRRGGRFGIIWIAATKATNLTKRDYCTVNVKRTCEEIINYIILQAAPTYEGGARPRFSLYLSSQLMIGVVRVFEKQQQYLFMDTNYLSKRFRLMAAPLLDIDLPERARAENVNIMETFETDPCFGLLNKDLDVSSFADIMPVDLWIAKSPREEDISMSPDLNRKDIFFTPTPEIRTDHLVLQAQRHNITMPEEESERPQIIVVPGEQDLPPMADVDLQHLMELEQPEQPISEPIPAPPVGHQSSDMEPVDQPTIDSVGSPKIQVGSPKLSQELDKDLDQLVHMMEPTQPQVIYEVVTAEQDMEQQLVQDGLSTPPQPIKRKKRAASEFDMVLSPVIPTTSAKKRRKQFSFIDHNIQMTGDDIRNQFRHGHSTSGSFMPAFVPHESAAELLSQPTQKGFRISSRLRPLWARNAISQDFKETDSDKRRPMWTVPELEIGSSSFDSGSVISIPLTLGEPPLSPVLELEMEQEEQMRGTVSEQSIDPILANDSGSISQSIHEGSLLNQSGGRADKSQDSVTSTRSRRRRSEKTQDRSLDRDKSQDDDTLLADRTMGRTLGELGPLIEEPEEHHVHVPTPPTQPAADIQISPISKIHPDEDLPSIDRRFISHISAQTAVDPMTTFSAVCPYTNSRQVAAHCFSQLLHMVAARKVEVEQIDAYDEIVISLGMNW